MIFLKRELLLGFDTLDQFLCAGLSHKTQRGSPAKGTYRWSHEEQSVILLCTIKVCSPGIAR